MSEILGEISAALQDGKAKVVKELVEKALADGVSAKTLLEDALLAGIDVVAAKFKNNEVYVPEVLIAARAMNTGTALLKPHLAEAGAKPIGKAILGTVRGDLHDIGKNLVRMMFEGKGIEVIDLGVDGPPEKFLEAYKAENAEIVALSALLTTTMAEIEVVINTFVEAGERDNVIIMIGGAPITEAFRRNVKADIYAADSTSAAQAAKDAILSRKTHNI
jgi:5-methyltetrahydrofolate--homocysteine methyltransferase